MNPLKATHIRQGLMGESRLVQAGENYTLLQYTHDLHTTYPHPPKHLQKLTTLLLVF